MMRFDEVPYVSDREAFAWARIIEPADPRLARRIRRGVWKRRLVALASGLMVFVGVLLLVVGIMLLER